MLVSGSIPNLVGGVSQQPPALRLPTTCERMENAWPSVVSGLLKRPPSQHVASITGLNTTNGVAGYLIERDPSYRYIVGIAGGDLKVYDLATGAAQSVSYPDGKAYLASTTPVDDFRFQTLGDYTFILNRKITPTSSAVTEPLDSGTRLDPSTRGTIYVSQAVANTYYSIYINNVKKAEYLTPKGVDASSSVPDTAVIADELAADLVANSYTVVQRGSTITITNLASTDTIRVQGNSGDKALRAFKDRVQSFSDLPPFAPEGLIVSVSGDAKEQGDDYYVIYRGGVWVECAGYNQGRKLDNANMPHVLIRNVDGTWTFRRHTWVNRLAGDSTSNSDPSFVGYPIKDIFVYGNRLGLLADENVILSEAGNFENFYRTTVATLIDSDRIDIAVLNSNVTSLYHAIPFNNDLLLMSDRAQFRLKYQNFLGPRTVEAKYTAGFNVSSRIKPINMGASIYFVDDRDDYVYSKVYEFFPKENVLSDDADEITSPVPEYMKKDVKFMAGSHRVKTLLFNLVSEPNTLYFYKYFWNGDQKVQTSWSKWIFDGAENIHWGFFSGSSFYMLVERKINTTTTALYLEKIGADEDVFNSDGTYETLIDRRFTASSMSYNAATDVTTIVMPYSTTSTNIEVVSFKASEGIKGLRHVVTKLNNSEISVPGNITTHTVFVGTKYTFLFEFSPVYPREARGQGQVVILDGRLQVRYITLEYHDTAYFQTFLQLPGRDVFSYTFSGQTVGEGADVLGSQAFASGFHRMPIMSKNIEAKAWITNDSPFPCAFGEAEWQGQFAPKSEKRL